MFSQRTIHGQRYEDYAAGVSDWQSLGSEACEEKGGCGEPHAADRSSPVTYADARNLCLKRRDAGGVKVAVTPQTHNGMVEGLSSPNVGRRCPRSTRRRGGRYGSLVSLVLELGNSHTASPTVVGHDNASVRAGGRRRRSSQTPRGNGGDRVKVRQAWCTETASETRTWGMFTKGSL